jgi:hypothetical protein
MVKVGARKQSSRKIQGVSVCKDRNTLTIVCM